MNRRKLIIALAVVLSLVGIVAVYSYVKSADQRALSKTGSAPVVIVDKQIAANTKWGDVVKDKYAHEDKVPIEAAPADAILNLDATISAEAYAQTDIAPGTIILRQMFGEQTAITGEVAIPKGKIAVAVKLPAHADVAKFVQPRSEVAVFMTVKINTKKPDAMGTDVYTTKLLLARIQVLAVSVVPPSDVKGTKTSAGGNADDDVLVTLALSQVEAERVILSQQIGQLYLGLLSDSSVTGPDGGVVNVGRFNPAPMFVN